MSGQVGWRRKTISSKFANQGTLGAWLVYSAGREITMNWGVTAIKSPIFCHYDSSYHIKLTRWAKDSGKSMGGKIHGRYQAFLHETGVRRRGKQTRQISQIVPLQPRAEQYSRP
jgi:hypothetical protein